MKLSIHAKRQLEERYTKWGLDVNDALITISKLEFAEDKFRMLIIDDIPLVLVCDYDEVITIYPHPIDAAESWVDMVECVRVIRKKIKILEKENRKIPSLQKKLTKAKKQLRKDWE